MLKPTLLPEISTAITTARVGGPENAHVGYGSLGTWVEANGYRLVSSGREVYPGAALAWASGRDDRGDPVPGRAHPQRCNVAGRPLDRSALSESNPTRPTTVYHPQPGGNHGLPQIRHHRRPNRKGLEGLPSFIRRAESAWTLNAPPLMAVPRSPAT